ncbi:MAG: VOC family protein [Propionibacteriales bacterium]|nr:VOC family protein [Propionibacteriales bacterium]
MTKSTAQRPHRIDYIELNVADLAEATRFYGEAFGWEVHLVRRCLRRHRGPGGLIGRGRWAGAQV